MTTGAAVEARAQTPGVEAQVRPQVQIALVDLLDRLLGAGVVISGDVIISLSGVDLVQIRLHALIATVREEMVIPR